MSSPEAVIGLEAVRYASLPSTMDEAMRLAADGAPEGTVVVTGVQTAGRGRAGRSWLAPTGTASLSSVVLRPAAPPDRWPVLALVVASAVADTVTALTGRPVWLKWPNDVWLGPRDRGAKVAGILLHTRLSESGGVVIAGIGLNANATGADLPAGATSLRAATGRCYRLDAVERLLWRRLDDAYATYRATAGRPDLGPWRRRAAMIGLPIVIADHDRRLAGTYLGIDGDGRLRLRQADGAIVAVASGELTRGPRLAPAR